MEVKKKLKNLGSILFWVKIGYHSRFNPECNTERGFKKQLYIELGPQPYARYEYLFKCSHHSLKFAQMLKDQQRGTVFKKCKINI